MADPSPAPAASATQAASPAAAGTRGSTLGSFVKLAAAAWILRALLIEPFFIPSGSMLPTMAIGDYLFVQKWPYGYSRFSFPWRFPPIERQWFAALPERGDVVVFKPPGDDGSNYVKRVVGLPGDRIEVRGGALVLNGTLVPHWSLGDQKIALSPNSPCRTVGGVPRVAQSSCLYPAFRDTLPGGRSFVVLDQADVPADQFGPVTVPAGHLFVMGDNRDDSEDSRFDPAAGGVGFLPVGRVVGRAGHIFWSTDGSAEYVKPWTWFTALRAERLGTRY